VSDLTLDLEYGSILQSIVCYYGATFTIVTACLTQVLGTQWLKPGGMIFQDRATMYMVAIEDDDYRNEKIDWCSNVYGFNLECIGKMALMEPLVDTILWSRTRFAHSMQLWQHLT
jgi:hypothetical protein